MTAVMRIEYNGTFSNLLSGQLCYQEDANTTYSSGKAYTTFSVLSTGPASETVRAVSEIQDAFSAAARASVWFWRVAESERDKRTLVYSNSKIESRANGSIPDTLKNDGFCLFDVTIEHHKYYEYPTELTSNVTQDANGLSVWDTGTFIGDIAARVSQVKFEPNHAWKRYRAVWFGYKEGVRAAYFIPSIYPEVAAFVTGAERAINVTRVAMPWADRGEVVRVGFQSDASLIHRFELKLKHWNEKTSETNPQNEHVNAWAYTGLFHLVMKWATTTDDTLYHLVVEGGYYDGFKEIGEAWFDPSDANEPHFLELGLIDIPDTPPPENYTLRFKIERIAGNGSLLIDTVHPMPADNGIYAYNDNAEITASSGIAETAYVSVSADDRISAYTIGATKSRALTLSDAGSWGITPGRGVVWFCADPMPGMYLDSDGNGDSFDIQVDYYPRFSGFAGLPNPGGEVG